LYAVGDEEPFGSHEEGVGTLARKGGKGRIDLADRRSTEDMDLQPEGAGGVLHIPQRGLGGPRVSRIDQHRNTNGLGHKLMQESQPLGVYLLVKKIEGRATLRARPSLTGSSKTPNTIGIVAVAALATIAAGWKGVAIAAT